MHNHLNIRRIAVVDSGLGGLTIHANLYNHLLAQEIKNIELIYFNVHPQNGISHRQLSKEESICIIGELLICIIKFRLDKVLIACNTLSILYPYMPISKYMPIPILGIIDAGVNMILDYNNKHKDKKPVFIILGTPFTINSNIHKQKLMNLGISPNTVVNQACKNLPIKIQRGQKDEVLKMVGTYLQEAKQKIIDRPKEIILVLCCTHFELIQTIIKQIAQTVFDANVKILNPNYAMVQTIYENFNFSDKKGAAITNKCFSNPFLSKNEIQTFTNVFKEKTPEVCQALQNYELLKCLGATKTK